MRIVFETHKETARQVFMVSDAKLQILKLQNDEDLMPLNLVLSLKIFNERILPMGPKYEGPSTDTICSFCEQIALQLNNI